MVRESLLTRLDRWLTEQAKAGPFRGRSSIGNGCVPQQCSVSLSSALLNGLDDDTTLVSLSAALDAIDEISSSISVDGGLTLTTDSANLEFAFAGDTSGTLTALGINTFFTGSTAFDIAVNNDVATDPSKFAASRGGCATTGNRHPADPVGRQTDRVTGSPV